MENLRPLGIAGGRMMRGDIRELLDIDIEILDISYWTLDTGCWMLDAGCCRPEKIPGAL